MTDKATLITEYYYQSTALAVGEGADYLPPQAASDPLHSSKI